MLKPFLMGSESKVERLLLDPRFYDLNAAQRYAEGTAGFALIRQGNEAYLERAGLPPTGMKDALNEVLRLTLEKRQLE